MSNETKWFMMKMTHKKYQEYVINMAHNSGIMWTARPESNGFIVEVQDNNFSRKVFDTYVYKPFVDAGKPRIEIPRRNWNNELANAIENSSNGDVIVCHSQEMMELAERAKERMCPDKIISFELE